MTDTEKTVRRDLRRRSLFVGLSVVGILTVQILASLLLGDSLQQAERAAGDSPLATLTYYAFHIGYYCLMLLGAPLLFAIFFRRSPLAPRRDRQQVGAARGVLLILFGWAFCVLANYLVNYWLQFVSAFGVEPIESVTEGLSGPLPFALELVSFALMPALVEELVFRGWFLGALRPFGERRALLLSALFFGLMHMNLTQVPFAFMLGLVFGFIYLRTGRLWPGMVIHFLNNALSVALDHATLTLGMGENDAILLQLALFGMLTLAGILAAVLLRDHPDCRALVRPLTDRYSPVSAAARSRIMWFDPAVIIGMVALTAFTVLQEVAR